MNSTEILNAVQEYNSEMTIKLFLILGLIVFSILMVYFSRLNDSDRYYEIVVKVLFMKIPAWGFLIFSPLLSLFLYNSVPASALVGWVIALYGVAMSMFIIVIMAFGSDFLLRLFGMDLGNWGLMKRTYKGMRIKK
jgi:hypothetical protein